ncbi:MAG: M15 family metallopeptidase [Devosia sp.]|uniref:M15 family metallopeptidase n=1 Tax=Devosia sp. TaxID=1871048 RepID=UPI00339168EA
MSSRDISELHPVVRAKCEAHMKACAAAGMPIRITATYRSVAEQNALYAQGRSKPGKIVTNAKGGTSYHNFRLAYDGVPEKLLALDNWGDNKKDQAVANAAWALYGKLAKEQGLEWGGEWRTIKDRPHCQWTGGLTLAQLIQGAKIPGDTRMA